VAEKDRKRKWTWAGHITRM